ncbi:hypothetical protein HLB44_21750 [Aquincola sp. S2]|uniref:Uncharacterized protein n=1 Tax=Pseudaquabacterium terrae TaxID=2732868 RepID=A0ABX2ELU4_9BURK|nr:hypothetical protein [Aquabacterium terrae]NRF69632.1 hypothetical protein [Aquabacterium terrae]
MNNSTRVLIGATMIAALAACGGGSGGSQPTDRAPTDSTTTAPAAATTTLAAYVATRGDRVSVQGFPAPTAEERAWLFDDSRERAVAQVAAALPTSGNAIALPPLQASFIQTVAAAARGETLAELLRAYPATAPGFYSSMLRTQGVQRQLLSAPGARFLPGFLEATDSYGPLPPLAAWVGKETGDLGFSGDVRLVVTDEFRERVTMPKGELFDGIFADEAQVRQLVPMTRFTVGVVQHRGSDFVAQALTLGGRLLVKIEPTAASTLAFSRQRLSPALTEVVQIVTAPTLVALPQGAMVLPRAGLAPDGLEVAPAALSRAFDELRADLRGLDGGGTYLRAYSGPSALRIDDSVMEVGGYHDLAFVHSQRNPYSPGTYAGGTTLWSWGVECPAGAADLRSFFLVLLDADKRVLALAAVGALEAEYCWDQ